MKKSTMQVIAIIILAISCCFAGCAGSKSTSTCYGNSDVYVKEGAGYHRDPVPLRFSEGHHKTFWEFITLQ